MRSWLLASFRVLQRADLTTSWIDILAARFAERTQLAREEFVNRLRSHAGPIGVFEHRMNGEVLAFVCLSIDTWALPDGAELTTIGMGLHGVLRPWRGAGLGSRALFAAAKTTKPGSPERPTLGWMVLQTVDQWHELNRVMLEYWPHPTQPTPDWAASILDEVGDAHFGPSYNAERGIVSGLRPPAAPPAQASQARALALTSVQDPVAQFFLSRNPGTSNGDGLLVGIPCHSANGWRSFWRTLFG